MAAASARWNSGRFVSIRATVSPFSTPSAASPAASSRTRSAYSPQVQVKSSPLVRRAVRSGCASAVSWNASAIVLASSATGASVLRSAVVVVVVAVAIVLFVPPPCRLQEPVTRLPDAKSLSLQASYVVGESHNEHQQDKHEPHYAGAFHDAYGHGAATDLLDNGPEDVPAVERQEREEVHDRQRERDDRQDLNRVSDAAQDRLTG